MSVGHVPTGAHARRTLIKPVDGKVRSTSYDLPAGRSYIYGKKQSNVDGEGAHSLMTQLSVHTPSAVAISDQDIVRCNKLAVREKAISAKDVYDFQLSHQHVKKQKPKRAQLFVKPEVPFAGPYGIASYPNMKQEMRPGQAFKPPPGTITKVIKGDYYVPNGRTRNETYPDISGRLHAGKMPPPRKQIFQEFKL